MEPRAEEKILCSFSSHILSIGKEGNIYDRKENLWKGIDKDATKQWTGMLKLERRKKQREMNKNKYAYTTNIVSIEIINN